MMHTPLYKSPLPSSKTTSQISKGEVLNATALLQEIQQQHALRLPLLSILFLVWKVVKGIVILE